MTDHDAADHAAPAVPDYELADTLELTEPAQYRALFEDTRLEIINLLRERAATTSQLADALEKPKGTVGHHCKVLEKAGLIHVVRTKKVRAIEARYYGRTARIFLIDNVEEAAGVGQQVLTTAAAEFANAPDDLPAMANVRYARIPAERAEEWDQRLKDLLVEFQDQPRGGEVTFGMAVTLYPTTRRPLPDDEQDSS